MKRKLVLFCNKIKPYLMRNEGDKYWYTFPFLPAKNVVIYNDLALAECDYELDEIEFTGYSVGQGYHPKNMSQYEVAEGSGIHSLAQIDKLLKGKKGYAIRVKNVEEFDKPKTINTFHRMYDGKYPEELTKNPSCMIEVHTVEKVSIKSPIKKYEGDIEGFQIKEYIFVPCNSEELARLLNGEQTIIIRTKVLNSMK